MLRLTRFRRPTPAATPALLVALAPLVYFLPATLGSLVLCPDDGVLFNLPLRVAAARVTLGGDAPLWNPYLFGGMPLLASAQGGLLYPLNWLYLLLPARAATNLVMLASYALAGLGAFFYARRAGADSRGALTTALVWQFCGFAVAQIGHTNIVHTAALLPWLLWSIEAYATTGRRTRGALVAVFVALQAFAGHQQTFAYSLLLACAYAACMAAAGGRTTRRAYLVSLLLVLVGLALAAVQL
ncbi:MAG TPA: hypothetical protein VGV38_04015, partial [Pyrinomonadaceae bacterium]|nr:hypothetical protein [Pyrinomonadaceae bacterium]